MNDSIVHYLAASFITLTICRFFGVVQIDEIHMLGFSLAGFFFALGDFLGQAKRSNRLKRVAHYTRYLAILSFMLLPYMKGTITQVLVNWWKDWISDTTTLASLAIIFLILWIEESKRNKATLELVGDGKASLKEMIAIVDSLHNTIHQMKEEAITRESQSKEINAETES